MPYKIVPIPNTKYVKVINLKTGKVKAKRTSRKKAEAQVRLLTGLEILEPMPRVKRRSVR